AAGAVRAALASGDELLAADVRCEPAEKQEWELVVQPAVGRAAEPQEVTVRWPDLRALPKDVSLTLVDPASGTRRYLRTTASYTFRAEGPRRLRVVAERRTGPVIAITGLSLQPLRGNSRAIGFTLSAPAAVDVEVVAPTGRVVAAVARKRAADAGHNQLVWTGPAAPGVYLLRATATNDEGACVQAVQPIVLTR
ncbi:MAG: hypothetical protein QHJ73_13875, partial [Armatimonadota bacterium]|nr:hypothetical protein [Armatimonadota bacterium]